MFTVYALCHNSKLISFRLRMMVLPQTKMH